jgi:hypothetical protein
LGTAAVGGGVDVVRVSADVVRMSVDAARHSVDVTRRGLDVFREGLGVARASVDAIREGLDATRPGVDAIRGGLVVIRPSVNAVHASVDPIRRGFVVERWGNAQFEVCPVVLEDVVAPVAACFAAEDVVAVDPVVGAATFFAVRFAVRVFGAGAKAFRAAAFPRSAMRAIRRIAVVSFASARSMAFLSIPCPTFAVKAFDCVVAAFDSARRAVTSFEICPSVIPASCAVGANSSLSNACCCSDDRSRTSTFVLGDRRFPTP